MEKTVRNGIGSQAARRPRGSETQGRITWCERAITELIRYALMNDSSSAAKLLSSLAVIEGRLGTPAKAEQENHDGISEE